MMLEQLIEALIELRDDPESNANYTPVLIYGTGYIGEQEIKKLTLKAGELIIELRH